MPLLEMETYLSPEGLFDQPADDPPAAWWVLRTRPRTEKALARTFAASGVSFFLPLHRRQWRNKGRSFSSYLPLFPNYIFVRHDDLWSVAPNTNQVVQVLPVSDQSQLLADLTRVHRLMQVGLPVCPEDALCPGARVLIESGPLAGLEGHILRQGSRLRFWVEVNFLRQGVSVEVDGWSLRPLGPPPR